MTNTHCFHRDFDIGIYILIINLSHTEKPYNMYTTSSMKVVNTESVMKNGMLVVSFMCHVSSPGFAMSVFFAAYIATSVSSHILLQGMINSNWPHSTCLASRRDK